MHGEDFRWFFDAVVADAVGLTLDTAHLVKSGIEDIAGVITEFGVFMDNVHLKDFADGEFRVLGEGRIDFDPVFAALRKIGYDGWLCADEESGSDLLGAMETCRRFMRSPLR
jgi:sugar phosphate isomerase/epimerase